MTRRRFYWCALWLPILVPAVLYAVLHCLHRDTNFLEFFLIGSGVLGGAQYAVFLIWAYRRHRTATADALRAFMLYSPFYFIPFCVVGFFIINLFMSRNVTLFTEPMAAFETMLGLSIFSVLYGYAYVGLVLALAALFRKLRWITE